MKYNFIADQTSVQEMKRQITETYQSSTRVVGWYAHPREIRGPFHRWFTVSEVSPQYQKDVGTMIDDVRYATACMNYAPKLVVALEEAEAKIKALEERILSMSKYKERF